LQRAFDEHLDEYPDTYAVFELPQSAEESLRESSWEFLKHLPAKLGEIPVRTVTFDVSKRKSLDASCLDALVDCLATE